MSARLQLKKARWLIEFLRKDCVTLMSEVSSEKTRCFNLLKKHLVEIVSCAELSQADTYLEANSCLNANVRAVTDAIVRKYTEQLSEYVRNELMSKYKLNRFRKFEVRLLAPALNEDHIKVKILEEQK